MTEQEVKQIVSKTIEELVEKDLMREETFISYQFMSAKLKIHYQKKPEQEIADALDKIKSDPYFYIIPAFYKKNYSLQRIAVEAKRDRSVIVRNKKRLVLKIYKIYTA